MIEKYAQNNSKGKIWQCYCASSKTVLGFFVAMLLPFTTAFAMTPPKDDRGSLVQPGGNSDSITEGATALIKVLEPMVNPIISFLVWCIAFCLIVGIILLLIQATFETHNNGGHAGLTKLMRGSMQTIAIVLSLSFIGVFFAYAFKYFYDDSVQQQLASSTIFKADKSDISLDTAFTNFESVVNNLSQPILIWLCAGFLTTIIVLVLAATYVGITKVHSGASSALRYAMSKVGSYVVIASIGFMITTIVSLLLAFSSI